MLFIFLLPPKYRYMYWAFILIIGFFAIAGASVALLLDGVWAGALLLVGLEVFVVFGIRYLINRIRTIWAEEQIQL